MKIGYCSNAVGKHTDKEQSGLKSIRKCFQLHLKGENEHNALWHNHRLYKRSGCSHRDITYWFEDNRFEASSLAFKLN